MAKNAVLLMGRLPDIVKNVSDSLADMPVRFVGATNADEVRHKLKDKPDIALAVMGAGLDDATRGDLIEIIADARPDMTIHLKDRS
jgi:DNA-binding NtrC family response regulator